MSDVISKSAPTSKIVEAKWLITKVNNTTRGNAINSSLSGTNTFVGSKNPRWREQVRLGIQAATSMVATRLRFIYRPSFIQYGTFKKINGSPMAPTDDEFAQLQGGALPSLPSDPSSLSEVLADNRAKQILVRKIRKTQTTFQGGVFLGEFGQTIRLITDRAIKLKRGVILYGDDLIRARRRTRAWERLPLRTRAKKRLELASSTWLEYQLGWAPLLSEIDAGAQALAEASVGEVRGRYVVVRAVGVDKKVNSTSLAYYPWTIISAYFHSFLTDHQTVSVRYIACVDAGISGALNNQRMGFAPTNWLPTIWELIPYSFVIDYFTNVGSIIDSACLMRSSVRWMVRTVRKERVKEYQMMAPYFPTSLGGKFVTPLAAIPGKSSIQRTWVKRDPYTGSLVPDLVFNLPNHAKQVANIVGLLVMRNKLKNYFS